MANKFKKLSLFLLVTTLLITTNISVFASQNKLSLDKSYYEQFKGQGRSLNVYNWGEYISDGSGDMLNVNKAFTEATGIDVYYSTFATNEELYSKLKSGNAGYDIIIPSDYMIGRMIHEDMLIPLDYSKIPNINNIDETFIKPGYDSEGLYSVPYTWGITGIIYNTTLVDPEDDVETWDILWNEKYLNDILMFSNPRDAFGIAEKKLGYSLNTNKQKELRDSLETLKDQKSLVQAYVMDEIFDKMLGGEAALAPYYAGDAITMIDENPDLDFAIPREGTNIFVDAVCIPKGSSNQDEAHMYINFLIEGAVAAANSEYIGYATPNNAAKELLDPEILDNPIAYPDKEVLDKAEYFLVQPRETSLLMDQYWTELLSTDQAYNKLLVPILLVVGILITLAINGYRMFKKKNKKYF